MLTAQAARQARSSSMASEHNNLRERRGEASTSRDDDEDDTTLEQDPSHRFSRYNQRVGSGRFKRVCKGFDEKRGIDVAWSKVERHVNNITLDDETMEKITAEMSKGLALDHPNIIKCYRCWHDKDAHCINLITEFFTSGNLRDYRQRHKHLELKAVRKWARQILSGLDYLHSKQPPVIHGDLRCDKIYINGHSGEIKIGDLGLATLLPKRFSPGAGHASPRMSALAMLETPCCCHGLIAMTWQARTQCPECGQVCMHLIWSFSCGLLRLAWCCFVQHVPFQSERLPCPAPALGFAPLHASPGFGLLIKRHGGDVSMSFSGCAQPSCRRTRTRRTSTRAAWTSLRLACACWSWRRCSAWTATTPASGRSCSRPSATTRRRPSSSGAARFGPIPGRPMICAMRALHWVMPAHSYLMEVWTPWSTTSSPELHRSTCGDDEALIRLFWETSLT